VYPHIDGPEPAGTTGTYAAAICLVVKPPTARRVGAVAELANKGRVHAQEGFGAIVGFK
jgi:hypothetical protein